MKCHGGDYEETQQILPSWPTGITGDGSLTLVPEQILPECYRGKHNSPQLDMTEEIS